MQRKTKEFSQLYQFTKGKILSKFNYDSHPLHTFPRIIHSIAKTHPLDAQMIFEFSLKDTKLKQNNEKKNQVQKYNGLHI